MSRDERHGVCHPECDEEHHIDCEAWIVERDYWKAYFGIQTGMSSAEVKQQLYNFADTDEQRAALGEPEEWE